MRNGTTSMDFWPDPFEVQYIAILDKPTSFEFSNFGFEAKLMVSEKTLMRCLRGNVVYKVLKSQVNKYFWLFL